MKLEDGTAYKSVVFSPSAHGDADADAAYDNT